MSIRFHSEWEKFHRKRLNNFTGPIDDKISAEFKTITNVALQNTVLNVSNGKKHISSSYRRNRLGCTAPPKCLLQNNKRVGLANCTPKWSPFKHSCFKLNGFPGKILQFSKGGVIVAGKASPSDVFFRAISFLNSMESPFYQALAYPNSVSSGQFRYRL